MAMKLGGGLRPPSETSPRRRASRRTSRAPCEQQHVPGGWGPHVRGELDGERPAVRGAQSENCAGKAGARSGTLLLARGWSCTWTASLGGEEEAELSEGAIVLAPALAHGHRELEEDLDAEEALEIFTGRGADALEGGPALADHDALLGIVLDEDGGPDVQAGGPLPLAELLHADGAGIGNFLVGEAEDLLPDGLGNPERLRLIRQRLPREIGGPRGQRRHEEIEQTVAVLPRLRGDGHDLREGKSRAADGHEREKLRLRGHQIGLVQDGVDGRSPAP